MTMSSLSLPQPNANGTLLKAVGTKALFEPAAGLSNIFGPKGLFLFVAYYYKQCIERKLEEKAGRYSKDKTITI
jgi:hypothetical protein